MATVQNKQRSRALVSETTMFSFGELVHKAALAGDVRMRLSSQASQSSDQSQLTIMLQKR